MPEASAYLIDLRPVVICPTPSFWPSICPLFTFLQKSCDFNELSFSNRPVFRKFSTSFIAGPTGEETVVGGDVAR